MSFRIRLLSGGQALVLAAAVVTAVAFAPGSTAEAAAPSTMLVDSWSTLVAAIAAGDNVQLATSISDSRGAVALAVGAGDSATLDLNGKSLRVSNAASPRAGIGVSVGATLTIEDSSASTSGSLTVTGGTEGAGIGGGSDGGSGTVIISGGTVTATGGDDGAGIGGGNSGGRGGDGGTTIISGGTVAATGGTFGAGIGGGGDRSGLGGAGGTTTISGGTVTAASGAGIPTQMSYFRGFISAIDGAAIGGGAGGYNQGFSGGAGGTVAIVGGSTVVNLISNNSNYGPAFGAGSGNYRNTGSFSNSGFVTLSVKTVEWNAGLVVNSGTITNRGSINSPGTITNEGTINNLGNISNQSLLTNRGTLNNLGQISNQGTINNSGTINNAGHITGNGTVGIINNTGTLAGNIGAINWGTYSPGIDQQRITGDNYTLTFTTTDGTAAPAALQVDADTLTAAGLALPTPALAAAPYSGWFTAPTGGTQITNTTDLAAVLAAGPSTTTLYAQPVAAPTPPPLTALQKATELGAASQFSVLAGAAVTAAGTTLWGNIGAAAAATVTDTTMAGTLQSAEDTTAALGDAVTAYTALKALPTTGELTGDDLGGQTITPGVYHRDAALAMTTPVTFDAKGNPNAIFVIQTDAAMNTTASTKMNLINGASAANIYWVTTGAATLGASSTFDGNIISGAAVTVGATSTVNGRVISITAAITLPTTTITTPLR